MNLDKDNQSQMDKPLDEIQEVIFARCKRMKPSLQRARKIR